MEKRIKHGRADAEFACGETKPNIFLIGDSIRLGYCKTVKESLAVFKSFKTKVAHLEEIRLLVFQLGVGSQCT